MPQRLGFRAAPKNLKALFLPQRTNMLFFWKSQKFEYVITCQAFLTTRFSCMLLSASLPMAFPTRFWFVFTFSFSFSCTLVFGLYSPLWNQKGLVPRHSITPHSGSKLVDSTLLKLLQRLRAPFSHPQPQSAQCYLKSNVVSIGILQTSNRKGLGRTKKDVAALARRGVGCRTKGSPRRHLTCSLRIIEKVKENGRWHFHKNLNKPKRKLHFLASNFRFFKEFNLKSFELYCGIQNLHAWLTTSRVTHPNTSTDSRAKCHTHCSK